MPLAEAPWAADEEEPHPKQIARSQADAAVASARRTGRTQVLTFVIRTIGNIATAGIGKL